MGRAGGHAVLLHVRRSLLQLAFLRRQRAAGGIGGLAQPVQVRRLLRRGRACLRDLGSIAVSFCGQMV